MVTRDSLENAIAIGLDRTPLQSEYDSWVGKITDAQLAETIRNSAEFKGRMDGLRKLVQESHSSKPSDADRKLQQIKDALGIG